jgi:hypothetical protein
VRSLTAVAQNNYLLRSLKNLKISGMARVITVP